MKAAFIILVTVLIISCVITMIIQTIHKRVLRHEIGELQERIKGLDRPEFWLPEGERQEHARKMLKREDEAYQQKKTEELARFINQAKETS